MGASAAAAASRRASLLALAVVTPLGFATKLYAGPGARWVSGSAGGILYVVFWFLVLRALAPRASAVASAAGVFLATSALEGLQLWHPPLLERVRDTFLGHALLGSTFAAADFLYYALGALAGLAYDAECAHATQKRELPSSDARSL